MVANLAHGKKGYEEARERHERIAVRGQELAAALLAAVDADTEAFNDVITAMRLPRDSAEERAARAAAIQAGYRRATEVPLQTARLCLDALSLWPRGGRERQPGPRSPMPAWAR